MQVQHYFSRLGLMAAFCCALSLPMCRADMIVGVQLDTSPLIGHAAGPFSINFQLNDGSGTGDANNTAQLSEFDFGGGGASGVPVLMGGAAGDLAAGITITDSAFFNAFTGQFTPGNQLRFLLRLTTAVEQPQPDQFSFAILDSLGFEIPTQGFGPLLVIDINAPAPVVQTFTTDPATPPLAGGDPIQMGPPEVQSPVPIPEPGTVVLLATGLLVLLRWRRPAKL